MPPFPFRQIVTSNDELIELVGRPSELAVKKELTALDTHMQAFIAESAFVLLGTVGRNGRCDVSPRGDLPGFVRILNAHTLVIPERIGNRRADSLRNVLETGCIGLLFMIPGLGETLRVNGRACVLRDEAVLAPLAVQGKRPVLGIGVQVEECFLQCARALIRSKLWEHRDGVRQPALACFAEVLLDQTKMEGQTTESLNQMIDKAYQNLY